MNLSFQSIVDHLWIVGLIVWLFTLGWLLWQLVVTQRELRSAIAAEFARGYAEGYTEFQIPAQREAYHQGYDNGVNDTNIQRDNEFALRLENATTQSYLQGYQAGRDSNAPENIIYFPTRVAKQPPAS
jgi:hypothetical protein